MSFSMDAEAVALQERIAERYARTGNARSRRWLAFLAEAGDLLAESLDFETTLSTIANLVVPEMADWCTVDILEKGVLLPAVLKHTSDRKVRVMTELRERFPLRDERSSVVYDVLHTGRSHLYRRVTRESLARWITDPVQLAFAQELDLRSSMIVRLKARGRVLGIITFTSAESGVEYDEIDLAMAEELAGRCALALDNALLHSELKQALAQKDDVIRERDRLLRALDLERQRLELVLQRMPVGVLMAEAETGRTLFANARAQQLLRGTPPAIGECGCAGFHPDGQPYRADDLPIVRSLRHGESVNGEEVEIVRPDGLRLRLLVCTLPLRDVEGQIVAALCTFENVTAVRRAEQEMLRQARILEQFIGILGHDLRNPLQAISGSAQLLLRRDLSEGVHKSVTRIATSADRMGRMITDLLDFTRSRLGGGIPLVPAPMCLALLAREIVEELEAANPGRHIELGVRDDGQGQWDRDRIAQVIQNLVGNALQYGNQGSPVRVTVGGEAHEVTLAVHNDGAPIPANVLPGIFEPFRRASLPQEPGRDRPDGLGLGLYITRQIVLAHGGTVEVSSAEDAGTTFTVRLPRTPPGVGALLTT